LTVGFVKKLCSVSSGWGLDSAIWRVFVCNVESILNLKPTILKDMKDFNLLKISFESNWRVI
jgi:hypothetical protein